MLMQPGRFVLQARGRYLFDRWQWPERVATQLGDLVVELTSDDGEPPDEAMAACANELVQFAATRGDVLLNVIYGHYRYAELNGWLGFWNVPTGLSREDVLSQVESIDLTVRRVEDGKVEAAVYVNPLWDVEHKLDLDYRDGQIISVNGERFALVDGVLSFN